MEKDSGGVYDPSTALRDAEYSSGYDNSDGYNAFPLAGSIPETVEPLKAEEIESRLKKFVLAANRCVEEETLLKIARDMPKKKNGMLYKGRILSIAYLDLVDDGGWTFEIVAKNEDDSQFCVEMRSKVPVVE